MGNDEKGGKFHRCQGGMGGLPQKILESYMSVECILGISGMYLAYFSKSD